MAEHQSRRPAFFMTKKRWFLVGFAIMLAICILVVGSYALMRNHLFPEFRSKLGEYSLEGRYGQEIAYSLCDDIPINMQCMMRPFRYWVVLEKYPAQPIVLFWVIADRT